MEGFIVKETKEATEYIISRGLEKQYMKVKDYMKKGLLRNIDFKLRQPKRIEVYQFRINKKYRGFGVFRDTQDNGKVFVVMTISDHQDF